MENEKWSDNKQKEERRSRSPNDKRPQNRGRDNNRRPQSNGRNRSRSPRGGRRNRAPTNRRIYVANIPYDCKWTTVKDLFREQVGDVTYVELFEDENGKFRGCGIVEFKESSSVQKAVDTLHRFEYKGRQLVVKEDFDVDRDKTGKPLGRNSRGGDSRGGGGGGSGMRDRDYDDMGMGMRGNGQPQYNTYGLSPQFLGALRIEGPLTNRVFVANLDYKINEKKLEEVFKLAGRVVKIDLKRDDDGKSKGHGTIEMGHPVEAVQAISMFNGQKFFNRPMSVRMDKKHSDEGEDKRLPEGLQGVGKGLGANGLPLHLSSAGGMNNIGPSNYNPLSAMGNMVGVNSGGNLLSPSLPSAAAVGNTGTGIAGLSGIGMSLNERSFTGLSSGSGLGSTSSLLQAGGTFPLGGTGASGLGAGLGATGLGSLTGGLGLGLGASPVSGAGGLGGYNDYDRSFDRGEDNYRSARASDTIILRNLPLTYTWENVRDRCADFGDVQSTEVKGRGMALVRFQSERDAARAVDRLRGSRIYGRPIEAALY